MTLAEAEELYKFCCGNEGYYMWHEAGAKAVEEYTALKISKEQKGKWDRDIIEQYLSAMKTSPEHSANWFDHVLGALARGNCEVVGYAKKLLDAMEEMDDLDELSKIDIIRSMGEDSQFHVSGCQFFCLKTPYMYRMEQVMERFVDFEVKDEKADPRFERSPSKLKLYRDAVDLYKKAFAKWSRHSE